MLGQRLKRWSNIKTTLDSCFLFCRVGRDAPWGGWGVGRPPHLLCFASTNSVFTLRKRKTQYRTGRGKTHGGNGKDAACCIGWMLDRRYTRRPNIHPTRIGRVFTFRRHAPPGRCQLKTPEMLCSPAFNSGEPERFGPRPPLPYLQRQLLIQVSDSRFLDLDLLFC